MRPTFNNWTDRVIYVITEAEYLTAGVLTAVALGMLYFDVQIPRVPPPITHLLIATLLFSPWLFIAGLKFAQWLRKRNWVEVHHVNAVHDTVEKYKVPPAIWSDKTVDGPDPWPVNGGDAWAVREFEWIEATGELRVRGTWLSGCTDDELLTSKRQLKEVHGGLLDAYIELGAMRDHIGQLGAEVEEATLNEAWLAQEEGRAMDPSVIREGIEDAREQAQEMGRGDIPTTRESVREIDLEDPTRDAETHRQGGDERGRYERDADDANGHHPDREVEQ